VRSILVVDIRFRPRSGVAPWWFSWCQIHAALFGHYEITPFTIAYSWSSCLIKCDVIRKTGSTYRIATSQPEDQTADTSNKNQTICSGLGVCFTRCASGSANRQADTLFAILHLLIGGRVINIHRNAEQFCLLVKIHAICRHKYDDFYWTFLQKVISVTAIVAPLSSNADLY